MPFSPEAKASGVGRILQPGEYLHYRRVIAVPEEAFHKHRQRGDRLLLQFGAVDERCEVFLNGCPAVKHRGGYFSFEADVTDFLKPGDNELRLVVLDDTDTSYHARGKQKLSPGGIFYTCQSGIWQTVWMEWVPKLSICQIFLTPYPENEMLELTVCSVMAGGPGSGSRPESEETPPEQGEPEQGNQRQWQPGHRIFGSRDRTEVMGKIYDGEEVQTFYCHTGDRVFVRVPHPHLWSPEDPHLYTLKLEMGEDCVESYFAMRSFTSGQDERGIRRFFLNGEPYLCSGVLDQGYWPESLLTPPSDEAMVRDILRVKKLGFNMIRKHVKIEPARWYYHCDRLGMLVWQDAVNGGSRYDMNLVGNIPNIILGTQRIIRDNCYELFSRKDKEGREEYQCQLRQMVRQLYNCPCVCTWVPFNEGWGQFDALEAEKEIRRIDQTRLIDHASGWFDQGGGDYFSIHNYFYPLLVKPGRRRIIALTEFGGYSMLVPGHGENNGVAFYRSYSSGKALTAAYSRLIRLQILPNIKHGLSVIIYTQLSDVEGEVNGLYTYDRQCLKINGTAIRRLNRLLREEFDSCTGSGISEKKQKKE